MSSWPQGFSTRLVVVMMLTVFLAPL
jgi:hypothetical protein